MAHLFVRSASADEDAAVEWVSWDLAEDSLYLCPVPARPVRPDGEGGMPSVVRLVRSGADAGPAPWVLVAGPDAAVSVNGVAMAATGFRVLRDRDEIRMPGLGRAYFSTESLAVVVPFPGPASAGCPRCQQPIRPTADSRPADTGVKCPSCGVWYHQTNDYPCWTYSPACSLCGRETSLDSGFQWAPGGSHHG